MSKVQLFLTLKAQTSGVLLDCARYPTALVLAASRGDVDCVEALLAYGADPNIRALGHKSALVLACQCGYKGVVEVLLKHGADPNAAPGIEDTTPLQAASHSRELAIVEVLLAHGADVNRQGNYIQHFVICVIYFVPNTGRHYGTALQACSWSGELGIAKLLVERGADVNIQGGSFGTALQAASAGGNLTIVQLLLEHGADVTMYGGRYGTALHAAAHQGNLPIVKLLLERGADIHVRGPPARGGQRVPVFGGTVLYEASGSGNLAMVELLLERGADVNVQGGRFATALQAAISSQNDAERLDVIKLLLERGADVNIQAGEYCTALIAASSWNIPEVVELLLAHGADINVRGGMVNHTPLHAALHGLRLSLDGGHDKVVGAGTETMKLLLSRGADPNLPLSNRRSILEIIDEHDPCRDELTDLLLAHGAV
ncbi:ankyrin repeat-containing domain protein [Mycena polygramma]|nr:ankyrin repeat-containing domain protein [Mycena polygramma]